MKAIKIEQINNENIDRVIHKYSNFLRTYCIDVNNKNYKISSIHLFNEEGLINSFEYSSDFLEQFKSESYLFDLEVKLKRKEDFTKKQNFILSKGREIYSNDLECDLYLHESEFKEITTSKNSKKFGNTIHHYDVYHISNEEFTAKMQTINRIEHNYKQDFEDLKNAVIGTIDNFDNTKEITDVTLIKLKQALERSISLREVQSAE